MSGRTAAGRRTPAGWNDLRLLGSRPTGSNHPRADRARHRAHPAGGDRGGGAWAGESLPSADADSAKRESARVFGPLPVREAVGANLAHATQAGSRRIKKGTLLTREDVEALRDAGCGVGTVVAVRLAAEDVGEDEAAARISRGCALQARTSGRGGRHGRVNVHAECSGIFRVSRALIDASMPSIRL